MDPSSTLLLQPSISTVPQAESAFPLDHASGPRPLGDFCSGKRTAFLLWQRMLLEMLSTPLM